MRKKADSITASDYEERAGKYTTGVHRIIDQSQVDGGGAGACQTVAVAACIEAVKKESMNLDELSRWYRRMDSAYDGKGEKLKRSVNFTAANGMLGGRIEDIEKIAPKDYTWEKLANLVRRKEVCVSIATASGFFSAVSGRFFKAYAMPGGHAVRLYWDNGIKVQHSWLGYVPGEIRPGDDIKFWEVYGFSVV